MQGLLAVAAMSGGLVGCGGGDKASSPSPTSSSSHPAAGDEDLAFARQADLRLRDFPQGWREGPNRSANSNTCPQYLAARQAARARHVSPGFTQGRANVDAAIFVYPAPAQAAASFAGLDSPAFLT